MGLFLVGDVATALAAVVVVVVAAVVVTVAVAVNICFVLLTELGTV